MYTIPRSLLFALITLLPLSAKAQEYSVQYFASFLGLPIGEANVNMKLDGKEYIIEGNGKIKGVAMMFTGGSASTKAMGSVGENRLHGRNLTTEVNGKTNETFQLDLSYDNAIRFTRTPHKAPYSSIAPITEDHKRNIFDPLAATFIFAKSPDSALTPETCERTIPVFSGTIRYDINLKYISTEQLEAKGYVGKALVCEGSVKLISGYRTDKTVQQDNAKTSARIWLIPIKNSKMMTVYRIDFKTKFGIASIEAKALKIGY